MAEYRSYQNYAALQNTCGQIKATLGEDPLPETITSHDVDVLANAISARLRAPGALCTPSESVPAPVVQPEAKPEPAPQPAMPSLEILVAPTSIVSGKSALLSWTAKDATKCDIQPGIGMARPQSETTVAPTETTTYTVTCSGPGGSVTKMATVVVTPVIEAAQAKASPVRLCNPTVLSVEFDTARWQIKPQYHAELSKLADFLKEFPEAAGEISGHTDSVIMRAKNSIDNMKLSQLRAEAIRTYLISTFGIDANRITAKGYGPTRPVASNNTPDGRQKNRRIETNFSCDRK